MLFLSQKNSYFLYILKSSPFGRTFEVKLGVKGKKGQFGSVLNIVLEHST